MKARFRAAGVPVATGRVIRTIEEARTLIAETGYPAIAKPDAGVGALNTYRIDTAADLHHLHPYGMGGDHSPGKIQLLCPTHNRYLAEHDYGPAAIRRHRRFEKEAPA